MHPGSSLSTFRLRLETESSVERLPRSFHASACAAFVAWVISRTASNDGRSASGAKRDRTADLLRAKQALSQLSYGPFQSEFRPRRRRRWFSGRLVQWVSAVEVEVLGRSLLKPEAVVLRSVVKEVRRLF